MQTFLPFPDYKESAKCLDRSRLGKQRVEAYQILRTLLGHSDGWINHPVMRMWRGNEFSLGVYGMVVCEEWIRRGYQDSMFDAIWELVKDLPARERPLFNPEIHYTHQVNLWFKDPVHYGAYFGPFMEKLPYVWE